MRGPGLPELAALLLASLSLSAPALARPIAPDALSARTLAYITLESPSLPAKGEKPHHLQFVFQVLPSPSNRCSDANVRLLDQSLDVLDHGHTGFASFGRGRRASFNAAWSFSCPDAESPDSVLERTALITVYAVNSTAPGVSRQVAVNFRQTSPPEIISVNGAAAHIVSADEQFEQPDGDLYPDPYGLSIPEAPEFLSDWGLKHTLAVAQEKVQLLERLNDPVKMRQWKIDRGMLPQSTSHISHANDPPPSPPAEDTDDDEYTPPGLSHERLSNTDVQILPVDTEHGEHPLTGQFGTSPKISPELLASLLSQDSPSIRKDYPLLIVLGAAALLLPLFSLVCFAIFRRRLRFKTEQDNQARRRRETVAERLARRFNRRHAKVEAFKAHFGALFHRPSSSEKASATRQHLEQLDVQVHTIAVERVAATPTENGEQTTMEQELAQFREAAAMVGNLVGSGGAHFQRPAPSRPTPGPVQTRRRLSMESDGFASDDDPLPTYEELAPSMLAVQDGFRYTTEPPSFVSRPPSEAGEPASNNSDRLGYGK